MAWVASEIPKLGEVITIPEGKEKNFLQDLPITFLPASPEILRRFQLLGIYRMGQLADLPLEAVSFQFGNEGKRLWELSNGMDSSRLIPWKGVSLLREQIYLEPSVDNAECLLSSAAELLNKLSLRLKQRCQYCHRLTLSLFLSSGKSVVKPFHFKEATSSKEMMLPRLKRYLERARFSAPVSEIKLTLSDFCCEEGKQDSFLDRPVREESRLSRTLNWLQQRYGKTVIKKVVLKENSALLEDSFTFIDFNF